MGMFGDIIDLGYKIGFEPGIKEKERLNRERAAYQAEMREAQRNSLEQRMKDAKRAGLHPLAALGAHQPTAAQYISGGDSGTDWGGVSKSLGSIVDTMTSEDKQMQQLALKSAQLDVEGKSLDNQYRASQLRRLESPSPLIPSWNDDGMPGQGDTRTKMRPAEIIASQSGSPAGEAGATTDFAYVKSAQGGLAIVPSMDVKNKIEDQMIPEAMWALRNSHIFSKPPYPGKEYDSLLPKGFDHWIWVPTIQEWRPANKTNVHGFGKRRKFGPVEFIDME